MDTGDFKFGGLLLVAVFYQFNPRLPGQKGC